MEAGTLLRLLLSRRRLARHELWNREQLELHQARMLRELRDFAATRSRLYARFHRGLENRPLHELPVLTKAMVMEHFDELVTDPAVRLADVRAHLAGARSGTRYLDRYWIAATAGSTGRPGIFLHDDEEWTTVLASYARANGWAGIAAGLTHRLRLAIVSSRTPWHQSALVGQTLESRLVQRLQSDATEPIDRIVSELSSFQPESLVGYASMLRALANEQLAGRLRITPRAVMSASEVLTTEARSRIRKAWGVEPFDVYAATEPAGIASECSRHAGLHLYEDLVITEIVDEDNRPVPAGIAGAKVLVTVLFRRTQPLIRYEMSDRVAWLSEPCPCGRPFALVGALEGRQEDVLALPAASGERVQVHPNVFHQVLDLAPVAEWQVEHDDSGTLRVHIAGAPSSFDGAALARELAAAVERAGALPQRIVVDRVPAIPRTKLGKAPLIREASPDVRPTDGTRVAP
jgi:putative adenylate-forming enzyme